MHQAILGGYDQLLHVVARQVDVARGRFAARAHPLRIAGSERRVAERVEDAPVDARKRDPLAVDLELNGELVLERVRLACRERRTAGVGRDHERGKRGANGV